MNKFEKYKNLSYKSILIYYANIMTELREKLEQLQKQLRVEKT